MGSAEFDRDKAAAKYLTRVQRYARKLSARWPRFAEDAEGEAVVALAVALRNYRAERGDWQTYVMKVVKRRVVRKLSQLRRREADRPAVVPLLDDDVSSKPVAARQELQADTLAVLTPTLRRAVELVCCKGMSHAEAAEVLGVSKAQVGVLLHEAAVRVRFGLPESEKGPNLFDEVAG